MREIDLYSPDAPFSARAETRIDHSLSPGILDFVAEWVEATPDSVAVSDPTNGLSLTYRELWNRAGWLAAGLADAGVRHGDLVAVDLRRSADLIVAFVGVVRAGAAYLPLDEQAPADRVDSIVAEAGVEVVVGPQTGGRAHGPNLTRVSVPGGRPAWPMPEASTSGDDTLYVTYTSGSTGRPKGVVVPHRGVVRLVDQPRFCVIGPGDRVANTCNPAFDVIAAEIWGALTAGATVVPFPPFVEAGLAAWLKLLADEEITTMFLTTSIFHSVAWDQPDAFASLRELVVAGEQLDLAAARRVLTTNPPKRLVNAYGPTEATVFATYFECTHESLTEVSRIPIGAALDNTSLYVLADDLSAVAPGAVGELCIGGPGVADGYLRRPDLTAEKFVVNPSDGGRIYRTGDLVRELPDGALEFLGRRDRQVKVRGFRIELEEIERAAMATGLVDAAFVEVDGEGPDATLVGLVLPCGPCGPEGDAEFTPAHLRARLTAVLPAYMVPTRFITLAEIPLGPTGKADRAAMARMIRRHQEPVAVSLATNPVAATVIQIVGEALAVEAVVPTANFIELGGNSIQAVRAAHRISKQLNVRLYPVDLLRADTIGQLAAQIARERAPEPR